MKRVLLLAVLLACARSYAQALPEVDGDEVIRRGNMVERIDGYGDEEDPIGEALAPPADDSHKWFITLLTQNGCAPCARLKRDFEESVFLQAFVNVEDHQKSWAHFNVYSMDDPTQSWRFKAPRSNLVVRGFPTLLVQPPRNGKYGRPDTVVLQKTGYDGDARKLASQVSAAIKRYVATVSRERGPRSERRSRRGQSISREVALSNPEAFVGLLSPNPQSPTPNPLARGQRRPPFDLPEDETTPAPNVAPPLVVPSPLDPDAPGPRPAASDLPKTPTAFVISEGSAREAMSDRRIVRVVDNARARLKNLSEKILDFDSAKTIFPQLDKSDLPKVVIVDEGKVTDQISGKLLPLLAPPPTPAPVEMGPPSISDLPVPSIIALLSGGGGIVAAIPLIIYGLRWLRYYRTEVRKKEPILNQQGFDALTNAATVERVLSIAEAVVAMLTKPKPPAAPTAEPAK